MMNAQSDVPAGQRLGGKFISKVMTVLPWLIVAGLLWAGIFVKPTVMLEKVTPQAIDQRDRLYGLAALGDGTFFLAGNYGKVLRSNDNAQTWAVLKTPTSRHLQDISGWDSNLLVAVGNGGDVIRTEDGGKKWVKVSTPKSEIANKLLRVHTYNEGEAWAVGEVGMIIHSSDYGKTWTRMREEEDVIMNDIIKLDSGKLLVVGEYGRIFSSNDSGETWSNIATDSQSSLIAIDARSAKDLLTVGLDGVLLSSNDEGKTWEMRSGLENGNSDHLLDVEWVGELDSWIAIGNKGKWMQIPPSIKGAIVDNFSKKEIADHTEIAVTKDGLLVVGSAGVDYLDFKPQN